MKLYPKTIYIFTIWLAVIITAMYLGFATLPHSGKFVDNFWQSLGNWDGGHYLGIAKVGYSEKFQYAFFPLYPLAIRLVNQLTGNYLAAAVLISVVSAFLGLNLLYKLAAVEFDKKTAEKVVMALLFFPASFFFLTAYSEGLFFFLVMLTFYLSKQKQLLWASLAAALASATRLVGLAVVAGLLVDVIKQGVNRKNWYVLLAPLGFVIYSVFLYKQTGDPFYFIIAEKYWQRMLITPGVGFWETLKNMPSGGLDLAFAIFGVGLSVRSFRFLPSSWAVYSLLSVSIPLFTPTLTSTPRFLLPVFPLFILVIMFKNSYIKLALLMASLMLLGIFAALFSAGYWVS